jgi:Tfp pilus assembly protein FimT
MGRYESVKRLRLRPRARRRLGITIAEALAAAAVVGIVMAASAPRVAALLAAIRLPLAARQLAADLGVARATAVLRNARASVTFAANGYSVRYEVGEPSRVSATLPAGVRIQTTPASGTLRFFPSGGADNGTIVLAGAGGQRRAVVVNQRGRIVIRR